MNLLCFASEDNRGNYLLKWINYLVESHLINPADETNTTKQIAIICFLLSVIFLTIIGCLIGKLQEKKKIIKKYMDEKNNLIKICQEKNKLIKELKNTNQQ